MTPGAPRRGVIPPPTWVIAGVVGLLFGIFLMVVFVRDPNTPSPAIVLAPVCLGGIVAGYVVLIGYIYGDAKRRCMRYVAWTLLAIFAPSAIGILLYFILRDPLPVHCTKCGAPISPKFAYCPRCGATMGATCGQCHKVAEPGWSHCAWCGTKL